MPDGKIERDYDPPSSELLSLRDAAQFSGLSDNHLRKLARDDELWAIKPGYEWLTTRAAVKEYLARDIRPGRKKET